MWSSEVRDLTIVQGECSHTVTEVHWLVIFQHELTLQPPDKCLYWMWHHSHQNDLLPSANWIRTPCSLPPYSYLTLRGRVKPGELPAETCSKPTVQSGRRRSVTVSKWQMKLITLSAWRGRDMTDISPGHHHSFILCTSLRLTTCACACVFFDGVRLSVCQCLSVEICDAWAHVGLRTSWHNCYGISLMTIDSCTADRALRQSSLRSAVRCLYVWLNIQRARQPLGRGASLCGGLSKRVRSVWATTRIILPHTEIFARIIRIVNLLRKQSWPCTLLYNAKWSFLSFLWPPHPIITFAYNRITYPTPKLYITNSNLPPVPAM